MHDHVQDKVPERCPFTIKTVPYPKSLDLFVFPMKRRTSSGDRPLPNIPLPDCFIFFSSYPSVSKEWCRAITTQWKRLKRQQHLGDFLIMEAREMLYAVYRYRGCHTCAHALLLPIHTLLFVCYALSMTLALSRTRYKSFCYIITYSTSNTKPASKQCTPLFLSLLLSPPCSCLLHFPEPNKRSNVIFSGLVWTAIIVHFVTSIMYTEFPSTISLHLYDQVIQKEETWSREQGIPTRRYQPQIPHHESSKS
jgi:hypothetical protein